MQEEGNSAYLATAPPRRLVHKLLNLHDTVCLFLVHLSTHHACHHALDRNLLHLHHWLPRVVVQCVKVLVECI